MQELSDVLIISGGFLGFFMALSLAQSLFFKSKANNYLAASLFILNLIMLLGWHDAYTGWLGLLRSLMLEFLFPVTLFAYFLIHIQHPFFQSKQFSFLYIPFALTLVVDVFLEGDYAMNWYQLPFEREHPYIDLFFLIEDTGALIYNIVLMMIARKLIRQSAIDKGIKSWLLKLNALILSILLIWFVNELAEVFLDSMFITQFIWVAISILFWIVLYYGVFKLQIAIQKDEIHQLRNLQKKASKEENLAIKDKPPSIQTNGSLQTSKLIAQLIKVMEQKELYKNPFLSRLDLATELNISEGYLSQIINQELNKPLTQFINEYRIGEAKKLLQDPSFDKYSIEAIGMEAGFKSRSAFYTTFKSHTALSPGKFRKQHKKS
jgi:AraC-like DNA-binding protein